MHDDILLGVELLLRKMGHEPRLATRTVRWGTRTQDVMRCDLCGLVGGLEVRGEDDIEPCMIVPEVEQEMEKAA
jgi:hypothetical protein